MVDSEPVWFDVQRAFVRERGEIWTPELASACVGGGLVNAIRVMGEAFGFDVDFERDAQTMVDAFIARVDDVSLKPGCRDLVDAARQRNIPCAVASSSTLRLVEATLARIDLRHQFHAVVSGECVTKPKPAPDIFLEAANRLRAPPSDCVVLEDSLAGVRAARAARIRVIAVPEGNAERFEGLADAVVQDLDAARTLLAL